MLDSDYRQLVPPHVRAAMDRLRDPQGVWDIYRDDRTVAEMKRLTALKRPALSAASSRLLALGNWVKDRDAKRTFGKVARIVIESAGYVVERADVPTLNDPLFRKGTQFSLKQAETTDVRARTLQLSGVAPELLARLHIRATRNRRSAEAEALQILTEVLLADREESGRAFAEAIHRRFAALGGIEELPPHPPAPSGPPPEFER